MTTYKTPVQPAVEAAQVFIRGSMPVLINGFPTAENWLIAFAPGKVHTISPVPPEGQEAPELRAAFEAFAKSEFTDHFEDDGAAMFDRTVSGKYKSMLVRNAYRSFFAGALWGAAFPRLSLPVEAGEVMSNAQRDTIQDAANCVYAYGNDALAEKLRAILTLAGERG